jgi:uncharacterized protein
MDMYDGYFEIKKMADGVYIDLFPGSNEGKKLDFETVASALADQKIGEYNVALLKREIETLTLNKTIKIADIKVDKNAIGVLGGKSYRLRETTDHMKLLITLYPPESQEESIKIEDIVLDVKKLKVVLEADLQTLEENINNKFYNQEFPIVKGQPPINQEPDWIEYHFKTEKDYKPEVDTDGNVNYHKLNVIANVSKGMLLATLHKNEPGRSGINIFGMELKAAIPKPVKLRRGKNVLLDNSQTQLFAETDGLVKLEEGRVIVNDTYDVPNHVGTSTGDIEFHGSIVVHGNVMTGYTVKAQGDIEVLGVVEGANVEAGGNIILHRGIQGMSNCKVKAGGNIQARYIENADVVCGGTIHSEAILHSEVTAKGEILVEGKKGMISGGSVRSGIEIKSNILGSHMGTVTNVEVGIDPFVWEEYNSLLKETPKLKQEAQKLEQIITLLNKRKELEGELDEQKQTMYVSATRNKIFITNKISISEKRIEELKEEVEKRNEGRIIVRNIVYPGVRITIGNAKYYVKDEVKYVKMYKDGADVKLTSL